jgi:glycerol kinase
MSNDTGRRVEKLKADGGASRSDFLLQFQSDILNATVVRPFVQETTSLGAAYLAGLAVGFWRSISEVMKNWRMEKEFSPRMSREVGERLYSGWKAAVKRSLGWAREVPWAYGYE